MIHFEMPYWKVNKLVCGLDEAGRGPLAGPLVVAGVILKPNVIHPELNDSKKLTEKKRNNLFKWIVENALYIDVEVINEKQIDQENIYRATQNAMQRIALKSKADCVLSDAMPLDLSCDFESIIKGDQKSVSIASASIVAKVMRDHFMKLYDLIYPQYGFSKHKGYPTKAHYQAIKDYGLCLIHRRSYKCFKD